jgi:flagellin
MTLTGSGSFNVAVGADSTPGDGFTTTTDTQSVIADSALVGTASALDVSTAADAGLAVTAIGNAVANLGSAQAVVGKGENTLTFATNLAQSQLTNEAVSESGLRDANMATEAANLTKAQILLQAGVAALAQANAAPQNILTLLKS